MTQAPIIMWFRRDLRLADNPALVAAAQSGRPVIPVFLNDQCVAGQGAAARMRLGMSVEALGLDLAARGQRLVLRQGDALTALRALIAETGAQAVYWSRLYDPVSRARDEEVKAALIGDGIDARSFAGHLLFEPWTTQTKTGGYYKVYTPFWRAVAGRDPGGLLAEPTLPTPDTWPVSDDLADWGLDQAMRRGAPVLRSHCTVGEAAARNRLDQFCDDAISRYKTDRDFPAEHATSGLSENLTYGEISPRVLWWRGKQAMQAGAPGAEHFLKEVVWREFAYHLIHHSPDMATRCWRPEWEEFPWQSDAQSDAFHAWCAGQTGIEMVDAGMRELWVTGVMHNRVRMIVASYLCKHLMIDWRLGLAWFADQLIDWDPASNAMGWQWVAGCGPDAAPYFRVFNPDGQADKFDGSRLYRRRFLAEGQGAPGPDALAYYDAIPASWTYRPDDRPRAPIVDLPTGRARALAAYEAHRS